MEKDDCVQFVPFSHYNWTFDRVGWLPWNPTAFCLIAAFCAVAYWMSIELLVLVYVTFKRHNSLYFWSIIITTVGILLQTTGYILFNFENNCPTSLIIIICKVGWVSNVTGFAIVLWSRLHLVVNSSRILKYILIMIIINGIVCHTPIVVFEFGLRSKHHDLFYRPMQIMERIQQTVFTLQETIISALYMYHTKRFLNIGYPMHTRRVIGLLLGVQILVVALDATLTGFDYADMFTLKCTVHPFVYSVKLKLEFIVLNQLQTLVKRGMTPGLGTHASNNLKSDSRGDDPPPPVIFAASNSKPLPAYDRGFITKAGAAMVSSIRVSSVSGSVTSEGEKKVGHAKHDSFQTLQGDEEHSLRSVVGSPESGDKNGVDDIERQYLGTWGGTAKR